MDYQKNTDELEKLMTKQAERCQAVLTEMSKKIVGQKHVGRRLLSAMIVQGHVLLEGMPGLAKTSVIKSLSEVTDLSFKRIQFTPDLLPADVVGTQIYDPRTSDFKVKKGPIFANLILADEINRAPAKVQSALLEAMEGKQITISEQTYQLEEPFLVMATQNPVEQEGTYALPEAQVDRFLFKLNVSYGSMAEEQEIINRSSHQQKIALSKVVSKKEICDMRKLVGQIYISDKIKRYIVELVFASRNPKAQGFSKLENFIEYGASPRASIALSQVACVNAMLEGRIFVTPQDVKDVGLDILRHRIKVTYEAEAENMTSTHVINQIFEGVDVP